MQVPTIWVGWQLHYGMDRSLLCHGSLCPCAVCGESKYIWLGCGASFWGRWVIVNANRDDYGLMPTECGITNRSWVWNNWVSARHWMKVSSWTIFDIISEQGIVNHNVIVNYIACYICTRILKCMLFLVKFHIVLSWMLTVHGGNKDIYIFSVGRN